MLEIPAEIFPSRYIYIYIDNGNGNGNDNDNDMYRHQVVILYENNLLIVNMFHFINSHWHENWGFAVKMVDFVLVSSNQSFPKGQQMECFL